MFISSYSARDFGPSEGRIVQAGTQELLTPWTGRRRLPHLGITSDGCVGHTLRHRHYRLPLPSLPLPLLPLPHPRRRHLFMAAVRVAMPPSAVHPYGALWQDLSVVT